MTSTTIFIDSRFADYQTLIAGLAEGTERFLLDATHDGAVGNAAVISA